MTILELQSSLFGVLFILGFFVFLFVLVYFLGDPESMKNHDSPSSHEYKSNYHYIPFNSVKQDKLKEQVLSTTDVDSWIEQISLYSQTYKLKDNLEDLALFKKHLETLTQNT